MKKTILLLGFAAISLKTNAQWALTGNAGTNPATNFLGTTDNVPLVLRANNSRVGFLNSPLGMVVFGRNAGININPITTGSVVIGDSAAAAAVNGAVSCVVIGDRAGKNASNLIQNILIGNRAGENNTGSNVTIIGLTAGTQNSGAENTMVGARAGQANTTGDANSFFGSGSGLSNTTGRQNFFAGTNAGISNSTGNQNAIVGPIAGFLNTTGSHNTFLGCKSAPSNISGSGNTFLGDSAGTSNLSGNDNVSIGRKSGFTGNITNAIAIGANANVGASNSMVLGNGVNVGIGTSTPSEKLHVVGSIRMEDGNQASGKVLTSDANGKGIWQAPAPVSPTGTAAGDLAGTYPNPSVAKIHGTSISATAPTAGQVLQFNAGTSTWTPTSLPVASTDWSVIGNAGTNTSTNFIGTTDNAGLSFRVNNTRAGFIDHLNRNTLFGFSSGSASITGTDNTLVGATAGTALTTGLGNTCIGKGTGSALTNSVNNTYLGTNAGNLNTSSNNTYLGRSAGGVSTTGSENVYVGASAGAASTTGGFNTFLGSGVALTHTTGDNNTIIGRSAASALTSGSSNTILGAGAVAGLTRTNGIAIGQNSNVTLDNCAVIGNSLITKLGIGKTPAAANILEFQVTTAKLTTGGVWTNASDRRIKDHVTQLDKKEVLSKIENLEVSRWHYKADADPVTHIGPMSQDFYAAFQTGDETTISTIDPSGVALIGIQQLSIENKELRKENEELKARLDRIEALLANQAANLSPVQKVTVGIEPRSATLGQNFPNPVTGKTVVSFFIPSDVKTANIEITSSAGVKLGAEKITHRGNGELELDLRSLPSGVYFYSLFIDGSKVETRELLLNQ